MPLAKKLLFILMSLTILASPLTTKAASNDSSQNSIKSVDNNAPNKNVEPHQHNDHDGHAHDHSNIGDQDYHNHGTKLANFLPAKILNLDDSPYIKPEGIEVYAGYYEGQVNLDELNVSVSIVVNITEDGLFNLAYYFDRLDAKNGLRYYADSKGTVQNTEAPYPDLTVLTGAFKENDDVLIGGLIRDTVNPVVLLDENGNASSLYAYKEMAYGLRETYANARVNQAVGLYIQSGKIIADIPHLIGWQSSDELVIKLDQVKDLGDKHLLVGIKTYELLQDNYDTYLIDHNDFKTDFTSVNDFVQAVLAMHLQTNTSFAPETTVELIKSTQVELDSTLSPIAIRYALLINHELLYVYGDDALYLAESMDTTQQHYLISKWIDR